MSQIRTILEAHFWNCEYSEEGEAKLMDLAQSLDARFLSSGLDENYEYTDSANPIASWLHLAVQLKCPALVNFLLERGADTALANHRGLAPLDLAENFLETYTSRGHVTDANAIEKIVASIKNHNP